MVQTRHFQDVVRTGSWPSETPVGIEPTSTGLQPVAWPSSSSVERPRQESNLIPDLRRVVCAPPHSEDKQSRRLDSHQHKAVYGTAAFLIRATSAIVSRSAQIRTVLSGFGDRLLSQEHTPLQGCPRGIEPTATTFTGSHADHYTTDTVNQ
jgi:hypothetical protein